MTIVEPEAVKETCSSLIRQFLEHAGRLRGPRRDAVKRSAISRITSSMRKTIGGSPKIPTRCTRCGEMQESVRAAKYHPCRKGKGK